ncbi:MAG: hypothetical protein J7M19_00970 [Planctomycetes bacterium]|nr:hypothetical protein [Planctomycetota bacterium]
MRLFLALALMATFCACAPSATHRHDDTFNALSKTVSDLPPSDEKARIERLIDRLQDDLVREKAAGGADTSPGEIEKLRELAKAVEPAGMELGFATGYKDWSGDGKPDGVEVYVTVRDKAGSAVKCPGHVSVHLGSKGLFGIGGKDFDEWNVSRDVLAESWNESLFPAYVLRLPWHGEAPDVDPAVLRVDFTPVHGKSLGAKKLLDLNPSR